MASKTGICAGISRAVFPKYDFWTTISLVYWIIVGGY